MSSLAQNDPKLKPRHHGESCLKDRVDQVVVLAGDVRATQFSAAIGCNRLELPILAGRRILDDWADSISLLDHDTQSVPLRFQLDGESAIFSEAVSMWPHATVSQDPRDFRGTAGLLKDLAEGSGPDAFWLVATGAQLLSEPLDALVSEMFRAGGDVVIYSHGDGTPGGLVLLRVGVLEQISDKGFVDFKEQALPEISKSHSVRVIHRDMPTAWPVRTLGEYIHALREYTLQQKNPGLRSNPFAEQLDSAFSIVADGAKVHPSAKIHDSIVLSGARVESDATLIRSVVGRGATILSGQRLVDRLVPAVGKGGS